MRWRKSKRGGSMTEPTEFQLAVLARLDLGLGVVVVAAALIVALGAIVAIRSLWS